MCAAHRSLISSTSNPLLERALQEKLQRRSETTGHLGELEPLAVRLGLIQNTLKPRLRDPHLVVLACDHGIAVEGIGAPDRRSTGELVQHLLGGRLAAAVFARIHGLALSVVDAGLAEPLPPHERLLMRKIAHGTRNARFHAAMSLDQAHAAIRAGMELGEALSGNVVACAGIGVGANESAALVLSRLANAVLAELLEGDPDANVQQHAQALAVLHAVQARHPATDAVEVLAAFGGFDMAMMVGLILVCATKRRLVMVDGMPALAALMVASRIAAPVTDYCVFCRSHRRPGLDAALHLFHTTALLELGMDSTDGTGATVAWPLVRSAAALLTEVAGGEDAGLSRPSAASPLGQASVAGALDAT